MKPNLVGAKSVQQLMTIDQNQTPLAQEEAHQSASAQASDMSSAPSESVISAEIDAPTPSPESQALDHNIEEAPAHAEPEAVAAVVEVATPVAAEPIEVESVATVAEVAPNNGDDLVSEPVVVAPAVETAPEVTPEANVEPTPVPVVEPVVAVAVEVEPAVESPVVVASEVKPRDARADADLFESYMNAMDSTDAPEVAHEGGYKRLNKGDRIEATVIQVDRDKVFVDLGTKAEGIIPLGELSEENLETAKGLFNIGDKITVVVIRPEGAEGNPIVSKKRADFEEAWDRIEAAYRSQEMIMAQIVDRVKGGLVADIGVRGFVPATHVGSGKLRNIEKFVGQPLQLKVIEIDRERKKVVLSNREAEEQRRKAAKEEIFEIVKPGDRLSGTVRRLADYGAFVDLGGVDGLLHISEMSWARINHPKEMFKEGQKIEVMVLRLDPGNSKISLGHRQVLPDPWNLIKDNYKVGQTLKITIGRIVQSGAFIKLPEGAEAFIPVSEMSFRRIKRPQDVVEENQEVEAQIIDLRPDERRMVLSMRALGGGGELKPGAQVSSSNYEEDMRRADRSGPGGKKPVSRTGKKGVRGGREEFDDFEDVSGRRGFATGGATIGERLGALRGILARDDEPEDKEAEKDSEATTEAAE